MEDLSARCVRINPEYAPSVSYLSMIERGKRVPSIDMLEVIAEVFQKEPAWFLDDEPELEAITPNKGNRGGINGMALEPSFYSLTTSYKSRYRKCSLKPASRGVSSLIS